MPKPFSSSAVRGRLAKSKAAAAAIPDGELKKPRVPVDQLRALGLRPNWQRVKDFPPMEENLRDVGLLALTGKAIRRRGMRYQHTVVSVGSRRGFPDLTIWGPGGVIFRELKGTTGELTVVQLEIILSLREAGLDAAVWWPEDYHLGVIDDELDRLAGVAKRDRCGPPPRRQGTILRPGFRQCGCHMDADHSCKTWGGYAAILPRS